MGQLQVILGVALIALGVALCYTATHAATTKIRWSLLLGSIALLAVGTYLTRYAPYIGVFGALLVVLSFVRTLHTDASKIVRLVGSLTVIAALLAIVAGLFTSPIGGNRDVEDRTDWTPPAPKVLTPQEMLALEWSTHDPYANWPVAELMLDLCTVAYEPPVDARDKLTKLGFDSESINAGSMQGYVLDAGDDAIVVLRGTDQHEYDILQDLRFLRAKSEQGSMHGGFVKGYMPMHDQVAKLLARYKTKRVWITGHSLGGGLAIVCAHQLLVDGKYPIAGVMTFGQPKVVQEDMADFLTPRLDGKYVFFVNDMDPVTRLIDPYVHFGHMVRWTDTEIERSKEAFMSSKVGAEPNGPEPSVESGYIEPMNDADLDELIQDLEHSQEPKLDKDGNQLSQGFFPDVSDHFLSSYQAMLEHLRTHATNDLPK